MTSPSKQHRKTNVGAGLLAKAVYQSTPIPTDIPPSRASRIVAPPLPHLIEGELSTRARNPLPRATLHPPHTPADSR
ncbi:hypothetical protein EAH78_03840 [Pseudomonas arsenicoxydans]|uniref:Uncharacterized protein n=1 Tax=Pseudomonas arsenicoxydans TaxID=702115 RepID=A0A502I302_9PSED|nr:hypothetical protein EAH78_03840 [Pseudomonas arsenicoxydans]